MKQRNINWFFSTLLLLVLCTSKVHSHYTQDKPRVIVLTDILNEPDDEQSMVRFLVHSNLFDVEAIIATTSYWLKDEIYPERIQSLVSQYGKIRNNLMVHEKGFPTKDHLSSIIKPGNNAYGMEDVYNGNDSEGSDFIIDVVDRPDARPVWVLIWGGANTLAQSILKVKDTRPVAEQNEFIQKLRVYEIAGQDDAGAWICNNYPDIYWLRNKSMFKGMSPRKDRENSPGDAGNTSIISDAWVNANVRNDHGPLGIEYPLKDYIYEGDSPSFFYILSALFGLSKPEKHSYGSWGGRFKRDKVLNPGSGAHNNITDEEATFRDYYMYSDAGDTWTWGEEAYKNNNYATIFRWREDFQREFQARMDWCVQSSYGNANHPPVASVEGDLKRTVQPGDLVVLSAADSSDPDGDDLSYNWYYYKESGTYSGSITINNANTFSASFTAPLVTKPVDVHVILKVTDNGSPNLSRYKRIIVTVEK